MVMSMYALLRSTPRPTMEDVTQALAGGFPLVSESQATARRKGHGVQFSFTCEHLLSSLWSR